MSSPTPNPAAVLAQMDRVLASAHFAKSPTLSRLLRFVVEITLAGKPDELKEYRLGVDVFERGTDFDPRIDPIVRMQAARLRSRLAEYYAADGRADGVVIGVPKGGYSPTFSQAARPAVPASREVPDVQSIAVLPFVSMSGDPENEYFSDGLTEELINVLTFVPGLLVVARTSAFSFKNTVQDIRTIGAQLNVKVVLEGSVRRAGNQLRVTAQLIDVSSGYHLLSRTYTRELKDVFAVQEELANAVVMEIMPHVSEVPDEPMLRVRSADLTAYNLYLKGMYTLSNNFTDPRESLKMFQQALAIDPNYAPASAGLAYAYFVTCWYSKMSSAEAMPLARGAAERALQLDPSLALGHTILGAVQGAYEWNWEAAERSIQHALQLQPGLALAHQLYAATVLLPQSRLSEAIALIQRAIELNPLDAMLRATATHMLGVAGDFEGAQQQFACGIRINPKSPLLYRAIGQAYQGQGNFQAAVEAFQRACDLSQRAPMFLGVLGAAMTLSGDRAGAEALLREIQSIEGTNALSLSGLHLAMGNREVALEYLERALDDRELHLILVPLNLVSRAQRGNPRFQKLMDRMGLAVD